VLKCVNICCTKTLIHCLEFICSKQTNTGFFILKKFVPYERL
jgi:hypothetical protein